jgi:hypothetical protein
VTVLLSTEKPRCKLVDLEEGQHPADYQVGSGGGGGGAGGVCAGVGVLWVLLVAVCVCCWGTDLCMRRLQHTPCLGPGAAAQCGPPPPQLQQPLCPCPCTLLLPLLKPASPHRLHQVVPNFRVRTIPVLGTAPAIFGMAAAGYILCQLAQQPFEPEPIIQLTGQQYSRALERLVDREEQRYGCADGVGVDLDEVGGGGGGGGGGVLAALLACAGGGCWCAAEGGGWGEEGGGRRVAGVWAGGGRVRVVVSGALATWRVELAPMAHLALQVASSAALRARQAPSWAPVAPPPLPPPAGAVPAARGVARLQRARLGRAAAWRRQGPDAQHRQPHLHAVRGPGQGGCAHAQGPGPAPAVLLRRQCCSAGGHPLMRSRPARCVAAPRRRGPPRLPRPLPPGPSPARPALPPRSWDASRPATVDNLVLLTQKEADAHDELQGGLEALRAAEPELVAKVERVLGRVRRECWE